MPLVKRSPPASTEVEETKDASGKLEEFAAGLKSADASERRAAARVLAGMAGAIPLLCAHLETEKALSVRSAIFNEFTRQRSEMVVAGLIPFLRSEDPNLRNSAIEALQEMPETIAPRIDALLADPDSDVRVFTVNILASLRHPNIVAWLRQVMRDDPHVNVCAAAIDAMAEVGSAEDVEALEHVAQRFRDVPFICYASTAAVRRVRGY